MQIGINWIAPQTLPMIRELIDQGTADFCEIMVDNVAHLSAKKIKEALPAIPIGLHIVASRFLEKTAEELYQLAQQLRPWIHELQPIYVSDHLVQFTSMDGKRLPLITEWDYDQYGEQIKQRVIEWQALLDVPMLFENHASITHRGENQAAFYETLLRETQTHLLFDFSNAYIAEYNKICLAETWNTLVHQTKHFHVAGFKIDPASGLALDTHDEPIADAVLSMMKKHFLHSTPQKDSTIVIEFDARVDAKRWKKEILKVRQLLDEVMS